MLKSNRDLIQEYQTELLQDFFEIQMKSAFPQGWQSQVESVVLAKQNTRDVYNKIRNLINAKGGNNIRVTDFDITALNAFLLYDFPLQCCSFSGTHNKIRNIIDDRNNFSHISNYKDEARILNFEWTAINNMISFLNHLKINGWNQPSIFSKYLGTGYNDGLLNEVLSLVNDEMGKKNVKRTNICHYLQGLHLTWKNHSKQYVALSYNLDGKNNEKKTLDELITSNLINSKNGMRIVAEGGYGKTWTLFEIAGQYADAYFKNTSIEDCTIPILIELGKLYKDCSTIKKKIAQLLFNDDETCVTELLRNNKVLLLIDAMDEATVDIQSDVSRELASLADTYEDVVFVCASRKSCIEKYPISIPCYAIKTLDDKQIEAYLGKNVRPEHKEKTAQDWFGENRKEFLRNNRTPFYLNCYVELINSTGDNQILDTTQLVEKYLKATIEREIKKTGFNSDRETFVNFLREFCKLLDSGNEKGEKVLALLENDVIRELTDRIIVEDGQAPIKSVERKLVEIQILSCDEESMLSFAHQNYKEYINRKYPTKKFRVWS